MPRCPACPGINVCLGGDGPDHAKVVCIGEAPGKEENAKGRVFIGKTGQELDMTYLPCAGLRRSNVKILNAISCMPDRPQGKLDMGRKADLELLESCSRFNLIPEIKRLQPKILVLMGAFACRAIDPDINLELHHGKPIDTAYGLTWPMYHPAGGIHEPKKMLLIRTDWSKLKEQLAGTLRVPFDEYSNPEYIVADSDVVNSDLTGWDGPMACDTETMKGGAPFCLTYSTMPGTGRLIRSEDDETLQTFQRHLSKWKEMILFHNWLFDGVVVAGMGLRFPIRKIRDTMLRAFHLGNLPQGLKALAYRELGMTMQDFDDLVTPHSKPLVLDYYREAMLTEWPKPPEELVRQDDGNYKIKKPQGFNTKLKRFFTDYTKNPDKDPFSMWADNWEAMHEMVQEELGPWPGKCISHAPFDEVLHYACRDADATLRLWPILNRMRRRVRQYPQERWNEAA